MPEMMVVRATSLLRDTREVPSSGLPGSATASFDARCLERVLDIVDYGLLVVDGPARVVFANEVARAEIGARQHPLFIAGGELRARLDHDTAALRKALQCAAARGLQSMLTLTDATGEGVIISVVPLPEADYRSAVLIVFGKRQVCENLSIDVFARQHGLTSAETRVLKLLCAGCRPGSIALTLGVTMNTVRTQIKSIRCKTRSRDIGELVCRVARLPPLACLVRGTV